MKRAIGIGKSVAGWVVVVIIGYAVSVFSPQLGIGWGTWLLVGALALYMNYSFSTLRERVGLDELPTIDDMLRDDPITPQHEASAELNPKGWGVDDDTLLFFGHFERFGDVLNEYLENSAWRLQQVAGTDVSTLDDDSPRPGRRYKIFHGPDVAGRVSLSDGRKYGETHEVHVVIEIYNARRFSGQSVMELMGAIIEHAAQGAERGGGYERVRAAMVDAMWQIGPNVVSNSDLDVAVSGSARWYLHKVGVEVPDAP